MIQLQFIIVNRIRGKVYNDLISQMTGHIRYCESTDQAQNVFNSFMQKVKRTNGFDPKYSLKCVRIGKDEGGGFVALAESLEIWHVNPEGKETIFAVIKPK